MVEPCDTVNFHSIFRLEVWVASLAQAPLHAVRLPPNLHHAMVGTRSTESQISLLRHQPQHPHLLLKLRIESIPWLLGRVLTQSNQRRNI